MDFDKYIEENVSNIGFMEVDKILSELLGDKWKNMDLFDKLREALVMVLYLTQKELREAYRLVPFLKYMEGVSLLVLKEPGQVDIADPAQYELIEMPLTNYLNQQWGEMTQATSNNEEINTNKQFTPNEKDDQQGGNSEETEVLVRDVSKECHPSEQTPNSAEIEKNKQSTTTKVVAKPAKSVEGSMASLMIKIFVDLNRSTTEFQPNTSKVEMKKQDEQVGSFEEEPHPTPVVQSTPVNDDIKKNRRSTRKRKNDQEGSSDVQEINEHLKDEGQATSSNVEKKQIKRSTRKRKNNKQNESAGVQEINDDLEECQLPQPTSNNAQIKKIKRSKRKRNDQQDKSSEAQEINDDLEECQPPQPTSNNVQIKKIRRSKRKRNDQQDESSEGQEINDDLEECQPPLRTSNNVQIKKIRRSKRKRNDQQDESSEAQEINDDLEECQPPQPTSKNVQIKKVKRSKRKRNDQQDKSSEAQEINDDLEECQPPQPTSKNVQIKKVKRSKRKRNDQQDKSSEVQEINDDLEECQPPQPTSKNVQIKKIKRSKRKRNDQEDKSSEAKDKGNDQQNESSEANDKRNDQQNESSEANDKRNDQQNESSEANDKRNDQRNESSEELKINDNLEEECQTLQGSSNNVEGKQGWLLQYNIINDQEGQIFGEDHELYEQYIKRQYHPQMKRYVRSKPKKKNSEEAGCSKDYMEK